MVSDDGALFGVEELGGGPNPAIMGEAEAGLRHAIRSGNLIDEDAGLVGAALIAARALDRANRLPDKTAVYAVAQLMRPFQDACLALGLPVERAPVGGRVAATGGEGVPSWLHDGFGSPE